jgi:hypothetical protein
VISPELSSVAVALGVAIVFPPTEVTIAVFVMVPDVTTVPVPALAMTKASVAILVVLSLTDCVVAVVPFGSAGVPERFDDVPLVLLVMPPTPFTSEEVRVTAPVRVLKEVTPEDATAAATNASVAILVVLSPVV